MAELTKRELYELNRSTLWTEKSSFDAHWRELAEFVKPRRLRAYVTDRNRGDRRNQKIIDSTATFALRTLQSGMHAGMSSPARPWFQLSVPDPELARYRPVKEWLHEVTERMLGRFQLANVYTALPTIYSDMGLFATSACAVLEDVPELFRCYNYPIGTYALGVSERGIIDTFVREYELTIHQLVATFGYDAVSQSARREYDRGNYQTAVTVCWYVAPNPERDDSKIASKYLPWTSCHFEQSTDAKDQFLRESGFREFPFLAPRWEVQAEDTYGTDCPGMTALGDVKGLQTMVRRKAQAVEKQINPPTQAPPSVRQRGGVNLLPGGTNYVDSLQKDMGIRPVHEVNVNLGDIRADVEDIRFLIRRAFYEDLFLMLAQSDRHEMTAREVAERHEEKLLALGPVLERAGDEGHGPLIDRVYPIMERAGLIPDPPEELDGVSLNVVYTSILSQAQKLIGITGMDRFLQVMLPLAQVQPKVLHKINVFEIVNQYGDGLGINPKIIVDDEQAQQAADAEAQAAAQAQQAEMTAQTARSVKDLSGASTEGDSALTRLMEAAGQ